VNAKKEPKLIPTPDFELVVKNLLALPLRERKLLGWLLHSSSPEVWLEIFKHDHKDIPEWVIEGANANDGFKAEIAWTFALEACLGEGGWREVKDG
jgi:hypothetical protein